MIVPDPEEQDRDGRTRHDNPQDTDAAFASIVAGLQAEPDLLRWPAEEQLQNPLSARHGAPGGDPDGKRRRGDADDNDHFQPPEPPPLPVPRARTVGGVVLLALGVLLLVGPNLLGLGEGVATPLGLLALTAGIGWLVIGLRSGPPPEGWDDGARL
ncbi:MAG TPA: DUF308 domain-containing protein [Pseudonocardiaceae bacterium]